MKKNPGTVGRRYGELLRSLDLIQADDINRAIALQDKSGKNLDTILVDNGMVDEVQMLDALSQHLGMETVDVKNIQLTPEILQEVPIRFVHRFNILPIERRGDTLRIATGDPLNFNSMDDLRLLLKCDIEPMIAPSDDIQAAIKKYYGIGADTMDSMMEASGEEEAKGPDESNIEELSEDASIIRFVNQIMMEAVADRATDIHFEPFEEELRIRYRIDGLLYEAAIPPSIRRYQAAVISRIKIMADMNIAEKRLPQDGRINVKVGGAEFDLRVSTIPTPWGESIVIRILNRDSTIFDLKQLGFDDYSLTKFNNLISKPHGIILVTGPTGSGKTTTLYATLSQLNQMDVKILTIEEPIEYHLHGIVQVQVISKIGLTFASVLRSFLRQDPDIILVGETRDHETAEIAIQAALTGHLVFTTLHTNDAPGAITRLVDMKVEPYLVSSSVIGVVAQRLMRRICPNCKEEYQPEHDMLQGLGLAEPQYADAKYYHGRGCENCKFLGYRGRTAIYEIFEMTEPLRELTVQRVPASKIKRLALEEGMKTLRASALEKVHQGESTIEELLRVTQEW
ncbi:MAG: type II secretion system protein GspE [bacterium]|nr:type II secretion system protein GspE [bacterium]